MAKIAVMEFPALSYRPSAQRALASLALLYAASGSVEAQEPLGAPVFDFAGGIRHHSNLSNAVPTGDRKSDTFWQAAAAASWSYRPQRDWTLHVRPQARIELASRYEDFSHGAAGIDTGIAYKAGLGHLAPRFEIGLAAEYQMFNDDDMSRLLLEPTLRYSQRLNDSFGWEFSYTYDSHHARSELHDGDGHTGGLTLRYEPGGPWALIFGYQIRQGDVVSYATPPQPGYATPPQPGIIAQADFVAPGFTGFGSPMTAYRLDALSHTLRFGAAYAISDNVSLECIYDWRTTTKGNLDYDANFIQLGIRASF